MTGFLDTSLPLPYCPGCGHPHVLRALDQALETVGLASHRLVLVTDIGCVGLADAYFPSLHTVHTLHGRATAVAAGMQLGEPRTGEPSLKPIVLVGDGGASIGLLHLVHAAQLNVDVTVIVHNNLLYGMTGGQHSTLTPTGMATTTTPDGCPLPPLDLGAVLGGAGCGFFARAKAPGGDLADRLAEAIRHPGFACVEAFELCPTFAARIGHVTGKSLEAMAEDKVGVLTHSTVRLPFSPSRCPSGEDPTGGGITPQPGWARLDRTVRLLAAGRAGERVQSAARFAATAAMAAGLHATVRTENPVTQGRGFSLAELTLASGVIDYTGMEKPDVVLVTAEEGIQQLAHRQRLPNTLWIFDAKLEVPSEGPEVEVRDLRQRFGAKAATLGGLAEEITARGWWTPDAWRAALAGLPENQRRETKSVLAKAGVEVSP